MPISTDLSDLRKRSDWAEAHPVEVELIAKEGTKFARELFSNQKLKQQYERFFGRNLAKVPDAY